MRNANGQFVKGNKAWWQEKGVILLNTGKTRFTKERVNDPLFKEKRLANIPRRENHPKWLGDKVGYTALHDWVYKELGRPQKCDQCGTTEKRMYHWANVSGNYLRDLADWMRLCVPCHKKYDMQKGASYQNTRFM